MKNFFKTFSNFAFIALMSAVVLRPVVVQTSLGSHSSDRAAAKLSVLSHHDGPGFSSIFRVSKSQKFSNLKVIPKEAASFDGLTPRFTEFRLPLNSRFHSDIVTECGGFPSLKPLVLRI